MGLPWEEFPAQCQSNRAAPHVRCRLFELVRLTAYLHSLRITVVDSIASITAVANTSSVDLEGALTFGKPWRVIDFRHSLFCSAFAQKNTSRGKMCKDMTTNRLWMAWHESTTATWV